MATVKKNIWLIYNIIACIGVILALALSAYAYHNVQRTAVAEQEAFVKMAAISISSHIDKYTALFAALDNFLLRKETYRNEELSRALFTDIMQVNPTIIDIGLFTPDGQLYMSTSRINSLLNLAGNSLDKDNLSEKSMMIGKPFKHHTLNQYYVPFTKVIRDPVGDPLAIVIAIVSTRNGFSFFNRNISEHIMREVSIVQGKNFQYLMIPNDSKFEQNPYIQPVPKTVTDQFKQVFFEKYDVNTDELRRSERTISTVINIPRIKKTTLSSTQYVKGYDLWVTMHTPLNEIRQAATPYLLTIWGIFLLLMLGLYFLFRIIYRFEEKKREALNFQVNHDYLTGLYNRYYLSAIRTELEQEGQSFWLLSIDINNFKSINNHYGHLNGDRLLKQVAGRLEEIGAKDTVIRFSGDEFIILSYRSEFEIKKLSREVKQSLEQPYTVSGHHFTFHCNLGIAHYPDHGISLQQVKQCANLARYESKHKQHQIVQFNQLIKDHYQRIHTLEAALADAILTKESIYMVYQPQVNADGGLQAVESLVRWQDKELGFIPPDEFIPVAEKCDLMPELGWLIINKSLTDFLQLRARIAEPFTMSINISALQLIQADFCNALIELVKSYCISPYEITLEITENIFIEDTNFVLEQINTLKQQGFAFALDDFGTGFSSLSLLKQLPLDELKLDKRFIDPITDDINAKKMLASIVRIGKDLKLKLVAEGVENRAQKNILQGYQCDRYQGYYFAKPLTCEELIAHFEHHTYFPAGSPKT